MSDFEHQLINGWSRMSSFSCPDYDSRRDACQRIGDFCVPGRPGCVLFKNSGFAVPWEQRLEAKRKAQGDQPGERNAMRERNSADD